MPAFVEYASLAASLGTPVPRVLSGAAVLATCASVGMDARGNYAAHTGPQATPWAGNKGGKFCTAQGNILAGESVVSEMVRAFEGTTGHLSLRLMAALDAGQAAGGDKRGKQSAAMLIVKKDGGVWLHNDVVLRLQVDDNPEPLTELRRLVEMNARRFRAR